MEDSFSMDRHYAFVCRYYTISLPREVKTKLVVLKPWRISDHFICFPFRHYENGWQDKIFIEKEKILAVGDMVHGTIGLVGYKGRYTIINSELFYKYYFEEIIDIKSVL